MELDYQTSLENPIDITIENKSNINQTFRYFDCNFQEKLEPGDSVKLTVTTSEKLAYYTKIKELIEADAVPGGFFSKQLVQDIFDAFKEAYSDSPITGEGTVEITVTSFNKTSETEGTFAAERYYPEYESRSNIEGTITINNEDKILLECPDYTTGFQITCNKDLSDLTANWIEE